MSEGLKFLGAVCELGSRTALAGADDAMFNEHERPAVDYVRQHFRRHGAMPTRQTVREEVGLALPTPREAMSFYEDQLQQRHAFNTIRDRLQPFQDAFRARRLDDMVAAVNSLHDAARLHGRRDRAVLDIREAGELVMQRLESTRFMGGITGAETGWPHFDEITGGYQNSDIITWVARPSMAKTYCLLKQAHYSYRHDNQSVVVATTEMGIEQMARRWASIEMGINPTLLKRNQISTHTERRMARMFREMAATENLRLFSMGMDSKVSALAAMCEEYRPSILYIDGAYLLQPNGVGKNASRTEKLSGVFDELKALNLEMNIPFVVTSQLNRQAGKGGKDASLENIGYTDAISTHSSIIVGLKAGPTDNPRESRLFDFLKGREGESGQIAINFKFAPLDMSEMPYDPDNGSATSAGGEAPDPDWMR